MINKETTLKLEPNSPSFKDDFQRLISLINEDSFINQVANAIKLEFNNRLKIDDFNKTDIPSFVCVVYWNRFSNEITVSFSYGTSFSYSSTGTDFLSWIPVLRFTNALFSESRLIKLFSPKIVLSINNVFDDFDKFKVFLSKKIKSKLNKNYKNYFDAKTNNDYSSFISAYSRGENFPIDLFPIEKQYKLFWNSTEIFSYVEEKSYKSCPYKLPSELLPDYAVRGCTHIIFEENKVNESFANNYEKFSELIIKVILYQLDSPALPSSIVLKRCLDFLRNQEENSSYLKNYLNGKSIIELIIEKQLSILERKLYVGIRAYGCIDPYKLIDENSPETDKDALEKGIIEMISKKTQLSVVSNYYEKLNNDIYTMLLENKIPMLEGFTSCNSLQDRFNKFGNYKTLLYSPVIFTEHGVYSMLVNRIGCIPEYINQDYNDAENLLIQNKAKTTNSIKDLCKSLLMFLDSQLSNREKEHLQFVLSMDVIDFD